MKNYEISFHMTEDQDGPNEQTIGNYWLMLNFESERKAMNYFKKNIRPNANFGLNKQFHIFEVENSDIPKTYEEIING